MYFLGIDAGTGGMRALVIDEGGGAIASATEEHRAFASPQIGWAEQGPRDWWRACGLAAVLSHCLKEGASGLLTLLLTKDEILKKRLPYEHLDQLTVDMLPGVR
jgi:glycerol kinase